MTSASRITLSSLTFTGEGKPNATVDLMPGLNILFGASNTGKSFAVKTIDFMLGGSGPLPEIGERVGYDRSWLALTLPKSNDATILRALAGGAYEVLSGHVLDADPKRKDKLKLSAKHNATRTDNLSQFLLNELSLSGKKIAEDVYGNTRTLSFRDLVRYCLIDEASIQSETSPAESGQFTGSTPEHSVLKLMLTGQDDSAIATIVDRKKFTTTKTAKVEIIDDLLKAINGEIEADYRDVDDLQDQSDRLELSYAETQNTAQAALESIRGMLQTKNSLARDIFRTTQRRNEIQINYGRFEQLEEVYASDIKRLESIEEAGFILALSGDQPCPLCGALPDDQSYSHGMSDIKRAQIAANIEIAKIRKQQSELRKTIRSLNLEGDLIEKSLEQFEQELALVEINLQRVAPTVSDNHKRLDEVLEVRDHVKRGLDLLLQRQNLLDRKEALLASRPATKADRPTLGAPGNVMHDFAQTVSRVLSAWKFPGDCHVSFDEGAYDLRIDGKKRKDNGKGVRAVTHSAFKVALLIYCRERNLPHPGFLVLDTPLLTYRDPLRTNNPLSDDEEAMKKSSLKDHFFEHLSIVSKLGQIIVVENVDLPADIKKFANVETFTGDPANGRFGLFPRSRDF